MSIFLHVALEIRTGGDWHGNSEQKRIEMRRKDGGCSQFYDSEAAASAGVLLEPREARMGAAPTPSSSSAIQSSIIVENRMKIYSRPPLCAP